MKVVLICRTDAGGGAAIACYRLFKALQKNNEAVALLVMDQSRMEDNIVGLNQTEGEKRRNFLLKAWEKFYFLFFEKSKIVRFYFSLANSGLDIASHPAVKEADIIHLHWINQGLLSFSGLSSLAKLGKPICWTMHDMWNFTGGCHYSGNCDHYLAQCGNCEPFLKNPSANDLSHRIWQKKQALYQFENFYFITCSRWLKELALSSGLLRQKVVKTIPNPIDVELFSPQSQTECRKILHLPPGKKLLLFGCANLNEERKGMRYMLEALQLIKQENNGWAVNLEIVLVGKYNKVLQDLIPYPVHHLGFVKDEATMVQCYNACSIFCLPSLEENLPNMVMEAMACGLPAVAFDSGGTCELIDHQTNGYLAELRNVPDMVKGIAWILQQEQKKIAALCREKVIGNFAENIVAGQYERLYEEVLKNKS
jgi:glycosyltransferase involved in cell wall biosynthesis